VHVLLNILNYGILFPNNQVNLANHFYTYHYLDYTNNGTNTANEVEFQPASENYNSNSTTQEQRSEMISEVTSKIIIYFKK
jgi:hypothetical protein